MYEPKENSYDIQQAKALSHKLNRKRDDSIRANPNDSAPQYTRFKINRSLDQNRQDPIASPIREELSIPIPAIDEFDGVESILKWCRDVSKTGTAFVVDGEGFILSSYGQNAEEESEGTGAELSYAFEHLDRVCDEKTELLTICLEYNNKYLYGFQINGKREERFILGLSSASPVDTRVKEALAKISSIMVHMLI